MVSPHQSALAHAGTLPPSPTPLRVNPIGPAVDLQPFAQAGNVASPRGASPRGYFASSIQSLGGYLKLEALFFVHFVPDVGSPGTIWDFYPVRDASNTFTISMVVVRGPNTAPVRVFLYADDLDSMKVKPRSTGAPDTFIVQESAIMLSRTQKYLCGKGESFIANRDKAAEWERILLARTQPQASPVTVSPIFLALDEFCGQMICRRFNKPIGVKNPLNDQTVTFGADNRLFSNWRFVPVPARGSYMLELMFSPEEGSALTPWRLSVGKGAVLVVARGAMDEFKLDPDPSKTCAIRHVGSRKLISCEARGLRVNRDSRAEWESFVVLQKLGEDPVVKDLRSSGVISTPKFSPRSSSSAVGRKKLDSSSSNVLQSSDAIEDRVATNEAWAVDILNRREPEGLWNGLKFRECSLEEAKSLSKSLGKPIYLALSYPGPKEGLPCLGGRLRRCTLFSDAGIVARITQETVAVQIEMQGPMSVPTEAFPVLADVKSGLETLAKTRPACRMGDFDIMLAVDKSDKVTLLSIRSMLQASVLSDFYSSEVFGEWISKSLRRHQKAVAKIGEGRLLFTAGRAVSNAKNKLTSSASSSKIASGGSAIDFVNCAEHVPFDGDEAFDRVEAAGIASL